VIHDLALKPITYKTNQYYLQNKIKPASVDIIHRKISSQRTLKLPAVYHIKCLSRKQSGKMSPATNTLNNT
jgi:hypothetical protein